MKKRAVVFGVMAGIAVAISGCQIKQYKKVEVLEQVQEVQPEREEAELKDRNRQPKDIQVSEPTAAGAPGQNGVLFHTLESSPRKVDITTQTASTMEVRGETVYVTADHLNVRREPKLEAEVIARVDAGSVLKRTGYSDSWSRVMYGDRECYVASRYLTQTKPERSDEANTTAYTDLLHIEEIELNPDWKYAEYAKIKTGKAVLYRSESANRKNRVVCVNAGHGTKGGSSVKTQCHPDGTPKVTGGTTSAGAVTAVAVSGGMQFADGTAESKVTLKMAQVLKNKLIARGYDVLMIREGDDVQLDNIARTVIANHKADCHIALHWDSTASDKGAFYMSVPDVSSYRSMEPVASHWQQHHALGDNLIAGLRGAGIKIFSSGKMEMDLTQTSYSTIPSVDIELGDKISDHSASTLDKLGSGLADGVDRFFGNESSAEGDGQS